jgi:hypothetical protein
MICAALAGILIAACAGSPAAQNDQAQPGPAAVQPAVPVAAIQRDKVMIDYRGASLGGQVPEWVLWASESDPDNRIPGLPRLNGKKSFLTQNTGQDLDLLQAWVNLQALGDAANAIKTNVETEAGSALEGNKNTPGNRSAVEQFINSFAEVEISGLGRELDFWTKERSQSTGEENYTYYLVFGITEENFNYLIDQALGKVQAATAEEKEMLTDIKDRMSRLRFKVTGE